MSNGEGGRVEINCANDMRALLKDYFQDLEVASQNPDRKVAWLSNRIEHETHHLDLLTFQANRR